MQYLKILGAAAAVALAATALTPEPSFAQHSFGHGVVRGGGSPGGGAGMGGGGGRSFGGGGGRSFGGGAAHSGPRNFGGPRQAIGGRHAGRPGGGGWHGHRHGHRRGWGGGFYPGIIGGAIIGGSLGYPGYYSDPGYYDDVIVDAGPSASDVAYCMQRFKSYDPRSGTYLGYDGLRHPCPQ